MFNVENKDIEPEFEFRNPVRLSKVEIFFQKLIFKLVWRCC